MGFVINRPQNLSFTDVLMHLDMIKGDDAILLPDHARNFPIQTGGPVESGRGFVLHSDDYQRRGPEAPELLDYLALHGLRATLQSFKAIDKEVGAGLLAACSNFGADMLGMGAYSHSRLRQLILGGVTRHVLENAALTVLMAR